MQLTVKERKAEKKGEIKEIRRAGDIPAIFYSSKAEAQKLIVNGVEFSSVLRQVLPGQLPTTVFHLNNGKKSRRAIIKDIQYHVTSYAVTHIDFEELLDDVPVNVKVPVNCVGVADCIGVKLGGFLRQVVRHVRVQCLPKHIPNEFLVDVKDLGIRQTRRLKDILMPKEIKPLVHEQEVLVVVAKR